MGLSDEMTGGPGARGKTEAILTDEKEKRKHFYIRCLTPSQKDHQ